MKINGNYKDSLMSFGKKRAWFIYKREIIIRKYNKGYNLVLMINKNNIQLKLKKVAK